MVIRGWIGMLTIMNFILTLLVNSIKANATWYNNLVRELVSIIISELQHISQGLDIIIVEVRWLVYIVHYAIIWWPLFCPQNLNSTHESVDQNPVIQFLDSSQMAEETGQSDLVWWTTQNIWHHSSLIFKMEWGRERAINHADLFRNKFQIRKW